MIRESLFAAEEREAELDRLGDVLQAMEKHIDFKALLLRSAGPHPVRTGSMEGVRHFPPD